VLARFVFACVIGIVATSCAHPSHISSRDLARLSKNNQKFVLVFGSVSTSPGTISHPTIRFVHQAEPSVPESLLWSLVIASGDRFFAVLQTPPEMSYIDTFYAEVGSPDVGFDRIRWVRLRQEDAPLAMYLGEIQLSPARDRALPGQKVVVEVRDDFQNAERELRRRYPFFSGGIARAGSSPNAVPGPVAPERDR
jgi:hypothetical protein